MSGRDAHQSALMRAARRLGIETRELPPDEGRDLVEYSRAGHTEVVRKGRVFSSLTPAAERICDRKPLTKFLFARLGMPTPPFCAVAGSGSSHAAQAMLADFVRPGVRYVVKPIDGTHGEGVVMDLDGLDAARTALSASTANTRGFMVEAQAGGTDLRLQAVGGVLVAACIREPAFVVGDGERTVTELVASRRAIMRGQNPENRLELDDESHALLAAQRISVDAVPDSGRRVTLKRVANMGQGAIATDVTDIVHPTYEGWLRTLARNLPMEIFAVDARTEDPAADPAGAAQLLEINARPEWLHHTFNEGTNRDIPVLILRHLFAE